MMAVAVASLEPCIEARHIRLLHFGWQSGSTETVVHWHPSFARDGVARFGASRGLDDAHATPRPTGPPHNLRQLSTTRACAHAIRSIWADRHRGGQTIRFGELDRCR